MAYSNTRRGEGRKLSVNATLTVIATAGSVAAGGQVGAGVGKAHVTHYQWKPLADKIESKAPGSAITGGGVNHVSWMNQREQATFDIMAYDATQTLAEAAFLLPTPGTEIVITDSSDPQIHGTWYVDDSSKDATVDGIGLDSITATRYPGASTMALLA